MTDLLTGLPADLGPWAVLGIFVILVLTGAIPTRRELRDTQADRDHWRTAADRWQEVATKQGMTLERLLEKDETILSLLAALQGAEHRSEAP